MLDISSKWMIKSKIKIIYKIINIFLFNFKTALNSQLSLEKFRNYEKFNLKRNIINNLK